MKGYIGLALLILGTSIAGAFGARNGATHTAYRAGIAETDGREVQAELPGPQQRLQEWFQAGGLGFAGGLSLIVVGAVLARRQQAEDNAGGGSDEAAKSGRVDFPGSLAAIGVELRKVQALIADTPMDETAPEAREVIDALQAQVIEPLVDGRGQLIARHGIGVFSEYFGPFSAGERLLNRTWSALTDGHPVVAREALARSLASFDQAQKAWDQAEGAK